MENKELARLKKAKDANELKEVFKSFNLPLTNEEAKDYFAILQKKGKMENNELYNIAAGSICRNGRSYSSEYRNIEGGRMLIVTALNRCNSHEYNDDALRIMRNVGAPKRYCKNCKHRETLENSMYCHVRTYEKDPYNPK